MEIDAKLRRELTKRFEMESNKREVEITENWRKDLDAIYRKKHESMASLLIDIKALHGPHEQQGKDAHEHHQGEVTRNEIRAALLAILALFFASTLAAEPQTLAERRLLIWKRGSPSWRKKWTA